MESIRHSVFSFTFNGNISHNIFGKGSSVLKECCYSDIFEVSLKRSRSLSSLYLSMKELHARFSYHLQGKIRLLWLQSVLGNTVLLFSYCFIFSARKKHRILTRNCSQSMPSVWINLWSWLDIVVLLP